MHSTEGPAAKGAAAVTTTYDRQKANGDSDSSDQLQQ